MGSKNDWQHKRSLSYWTLPSQCMLILYNVTSFYIPNILTYILYKQFSILYFIEPTLLYQCMMILILNTISNLKISLPYYISILCTILVLLCCLRLCIMLFAKARPISLAYVSPPAPCVVTETWKWHLFVGYVPWYDAKSITTRPGMLPIVWYE